MNFSLIDAGGLVIAVLSYVPLVILPGVALAALSETFGFNAADGRRQQGLALVVGLALLPALDSLLTRFASLGAALALNLALAALALLLAWRQRWRWPLSLATSGVLAVWLVVLGLEWIDFDFGSALYQPFTAIDMVKHAATAQAIFDGGAPPHDPFFARPERVSYYYFFYTLAALSQKLCGGLVDARAAVGGLAFWAGVGVAALGRLVIVKAALVRPGAERRIGLILLLLLGAGGLDVLMVARRGLDGGGWLPDPIWWNEQVTGWLESLLWVPHHVVALIASIVGFLAVTEAQVAKRGRVVVATLCAGLCFASALGLSVWVTLAAVATAGLWLGALLIERRWRAAAIVALAGLAAAVVAAPHLVDLLAGRGGGVPIEPTVRAFASSDAVFTREPWRSLARLVLLPLNYFVGFGALFLGALLFWSERRFADIHRNEMARVLTFSAIAALLLGSFLRSTLFNNDLGWRVMLFALFAGLVWSAVVVERHWAARKDRGRRGRPSLLTVLIVIGYATSLYALVGIRAYPLMPVPDETRLLAEHPATARALRVAYAWGNANLPQTAVLQHNPDAARVVAFGLYSRNPVGVGDAYASLFGADPAAVATRGSEVVALFTQNLPAREVGARAKANGIDDLVVSIDDPVWQMSGSWVWQAKAAYASDRVRIIPVAALAS